jgi:hypothetical protein
LRLRRRLKPTLPEERNRGIAKKVEIECVLGWGTGRNACATAQGGVGLGYAFAENRPGEPRHSKWVYGIRCGGGGAF